MGEGVERKCESLGWQYLVNSESLQQVIGQLNIR